VDSQQAGLVEQMVDQVTVHREGGLDIKRLAANLRGLFDATGIRSPELRDEFQALWGEIDMKAELRTEPWAPPGAASDERLDAALDSLVIWAGDAVRRSDGQRAEVPLGAGPRVRHPAVCADLDAALWASWSI
jgi:hypothetical protein